MRSGLLAVVVVVAATLPTQALARELRVCADANNLPFSNESGEGFENKIAELIAQELDARVAIHGGLSGGASSATP